MFYAHCLPPFAPPIKVLTLFFSLRVLRSDGRPPGILLLPHATAAAATAAAATPGDADAPDGAVVGVVAAADAGLPVAVAHQADARVPAAAAATDAMKKEESRKKKHPAKPTSDFARQVSKKGAQIGLTLKGGGGGSLRAYFFPVTLSCLTNEVAIRRKESERKGKGGAKKRRKKEGAEKRIS